MTPPNHTLSNAGQLSASQERTWFRVWLACLAMFFVVAGAGSLYFLWEAKHAESLRRRQWLDPVAPDPGVTVAASSSTEKAERVAIGCYIERIPELSLREAKWSVVFDVWFRWSGDLAPPAEALVVMEGAIESNDRLAEHHDGDSHYERRRIVATINKAFPAAQAPFDSHLLTLGIENGDLIRERMVFVPDLESCGVSSRAVIPGYRIGSWQSIEKPHSYKTTKGDPRLPPGTQSTHSQFRMAVVVERDGWGLYWKLFQALHVAVAIAFLACFIKPTDVDPRFGLGVGALFAAVANSYVVNSLTGDSGDFSLADVVNVLGILTILVTLIESTVSLYLYDQCEEQELSRRLDRASFRVLVVGFVAVNTAVLLASRAL